MAHWDNIKLEVIYSKATPSELYPDWDEMDCGCCNGLTWHYGNECYRCGGKGFVCKHRKSGVIAEYPGGRFC